MLSLLTVFALEIKIMHYGILLNILDIVIAFQQLKGSYTVAKNLAKPKTEA